MSRYKHLDIEEYSKEETHQSDGEMVNASGYKVSSLVANPRHHLMSMMFITVADSSEISGIFVDICDNIISRLRLILLSVEKITANLRPINGIQFTILETADGLERGILIIPGETNTISNLITRAVNDNIPDISSITGLVYENKAEIVIQHTENVTSILTDAIQYCLFIFTTIKKAF